MAKIFRNVRRQLMSENKVMAYLRYAIGEIFLVVIGILIALQVNNWNEHRKQKKQETIYLQDLSIDLKKQIQLQNNYIDFENIIIQDCKDIVAHYEQNNGFKKMDSIFPENKRPEYKNELYQRQYNTFGNDKFGRHQYY